MSAKPAKPAVPALLAEPGKPTEPALPALLAPPALSALAAQPAHSIEPSAVRWGGGPPLRLTTDDPAGLGVGKSGTKTRSLAKILGNSRTNTRYLADF